MNKSAKMMMLSRNGNNDSYKYDRQGESREYRDPRREGRYDDRGRRDMERGRRDREYGYSGGDRNYREYGREGRDGRYYDDGRRESRYERDDFDDDDYDHHSRLMGGGAFWMQSPQKGYQKLTKEKAKEWVENMENEDESHPEGGKWTMEEVKPYAQKLGIPAEGQKFIDFYAMMNAMYSDYYKVAKKYNVATPDFFAEMAKSWIDDSDAVKNKTAIYYDCIVKH